MPADPEVIGGIRVTIGGDYSQLASDLQAAQDLASSAGQQIAEALNAGSAGADTLGASLDTVTSSSTGATEQLSLFATQTEGVPFADAGGQLNLFTDELETFAGGATTAASSEADLATETADVGRAAEETAPKVSELGSSVSGAGAQAHGAEEGFSGFAESLEGLAGKLGVGVGIAELGHQFWEATTNIQNAGLMLGFIEGSADAAGKQIEALKELAQSEALSFPSLLIADQRMEATRHFLQSEIIPALAAAGDAAHITASDIETVAQRMTMMADSGMAMNRALITLGINSEDLGRVLGVTADDASKAFKALGDPEKRLEALTEAMQKNAGAGEVWGSGWSGRLQRWKNEWEDALAAVGNGLAKSETALLHFDESMLSTAAGGIIKLKDAIFGVPLQKFHSDLEDFGNLPSGAFGPMASSAHNLAIEISLADAKAQAMSITHEDLKKNVTAAAQALRDAVTAFDATGKGAAQVTQAYKDLQAAEKAAATSSQDAGPAHTFNVAGIKDFNVALAETMQRSLQNADTMRVVDTLLGDMDPKFAAVTANTDGLAAAMKNLDSEAQHVSMPIKTDAQIIDEFARHAAQSTTATSGLLKDLGRDSTGLGNQLGALAFHAKDFSQAWDTAITDVAQKMVQTLIGFALKQLFSAIMMVTNPLAGIFGLASGSSIGLGSDLSAFGIAVPQFAGGADLGGSGTFAQLHPYEMVLPQPEADVIRSLADGSGTMSEGRAASGDIHVHVGSVIGGVTQSMVDDMMNKAVKQTRRVGATW